MWKTLLKDPQDFLFSNAILTFNENWIYTHYKYETFIIENNAWKRRGHIETKFLSHNLYGEKFSEKMLDDGTRSTHYLMRFQASQTNQQPSLFFMFKSIFSHSFYEQIVFKLLKVIVRNAQNDEYTSNKTIFTIPKYFLLCFRHQTNMYFRNWSIETRGSPLRQEQVRYTVQF